MVLQSLPPYPQARSYVLQLHRECAPAQGGLHGRIEHLSSGEAVEFSSAEALLEWLRSHIATHTGSAPGSHA